jgi:hypothetical protein
LFFSYGTNDKFTVNGGPGIMTLSSSRQKLFRVWTHVAVVTTPTESMLYINGKFDVGQVGTPLALSSITSLGSRDLLSSMKEVRISKIARYEKNFTPAKRFELDADTIAQYHCDEGAGETLTDSSGNYHGKIVDAKWVLDR